jgi:hypothetical protein
MTRPIEAHFHLDDHGTMGRKYVWDDLIRAIAGINIMHPIVRASLYVATGGVVLGGSMLTIPTAPILAVAGLAAGTIILAKTINTQRRKDKSQKNK